MENLRDISKAIFQEKSEILGHLMLGFIERKFEHLLHQEICFCLHCNMSMQKNPNNLKTVETLSGCIKLNRPYFYCRRCKFGYYPLDEALELSDSSKQYDVQDAEVWLSTETPYETARETYERISGMKMSEHHMHTTTNKIGETVDIFDVCPTKEEIDILVDNASKNKFRRPIMMLAIDGAHAPTRPEPSPHPRKGKRGKGQWKEVKGFRLYLLNNNTIIHLCSWHQICDDHELADNLLKIKNAGLIPASKIRLGIIGDGAPWIWNRCKEIFPNAKEILDYFHCSEYVHGVANTYYGKNTPEARMWCEVALTKIYYGQHDDVLSDLEQMNTQIKEVQEKIDTFYNYLKNNRGKMNYNSAKRGGYQIGSGAIESANKFISHTRLKRSGSWWYIKNANNILKIRCAKYNNTYDKIMKNYKIFDQARMKNLKHKNGLLN